MKTTDRSTFSKLTLATTLSLAVTPWSLPAAADTEVFGSMIKVPPGDVFNTAALSGNGRFVASNSRADYLIENDANGDGRDLFLLDRSNGEYSLLSVDSNGNQLTSGGGSARIPVAISDDGQTVLMRNYWHPLGGDAYLYDGETETARQMPFSVPVDMSEDGSVIAYLERTVDDTFSLYTYTVGTGQKELIASEINDLDFLPKVDLSANGRHVAFTTKIQLTGTDQNDQVNVYHFDRQTMTTTLVTMNTSNASKLAGISADGSKVGFYDENAVYYFDTQASTYETAAAASDTDRVLMSNSANLFAIKRTPYLHLLAADSGESETVARSSQGLYGVADDGTVAFSTFKAEVKYDTNEMGDVYLKQISLPQ